MRLLSVIAITIVSLLGVQPLEAATLTWNVNPEPDVKGYIVSYGTQPGSHTTSVNVGEALTFNLTPPVGQRYYVVVQAFNDSGPGEKSNELMLELTVTNQPPTLNQPPNQSGTVGNSATLNLTGSDPEGRPVSFTATGLPPGLNINATTGAIAGTLQTAGNYNVTATVSDGSLTASRTFTWVVAAATSPSPTPTPTPTPPAPTDTTAPVITFVDPTNNETVSGKNVKLRVTATDASGVKSLRYLLDGAAISGDLAAPYNFTWDISKVSDGAHQLSARAVDNAGNVGTKTITVTVKPAGNNGKKGVLESTASDGVSAESDSASDSDTRDRSNLDVPVKADFDGDGLVDAGTFTAATGEWRLRLSSMNYNALAPLVWGADGDVPVPADYDGDGRADLAVFRPAAGAWSIVLSNNGNPSRLDLAWGRDGDNVLAFDYDQDGRADLALQRGGGFDILLSSKNFASSVSVQ